MIKNYVSRCYPGGSIFTGDLGQLYSGYNKRGMNEKERAGIIVFVSRLINLEDKELRKQFFKELRKMEGKNDMNEMTWIEEHFYDQALSKGITIGETRGRLEGRSETLNAAIDFMRSNGMIDDKINDFKNLIPILKN